MLFFLFVHLILIEENFLKEEKIIYFINEVILIKYSYLIETK